MQFEKYEKQKKSSSQRAYYKLYKNQDRSFFSLHLLLFPLYVYI